MAAVAMVIMCLGGLIPVATYICPTFCCLILALVLRQCGCRIAWAWYGAVAILSLLLAPDREAAAVFVFLGYYPILKPKFDGLKLKWLWKMLLFNGSVFLMYSILIWVFGVSELSSEFRDTGVWLLVIMLAMGNLIFVLLDRILNRFGSVRR